jgi:hypothetical protein
VVTVIKIEQFKIELKEIKNIATNQIEQEKSNFTNFDFISLKNNSLIFVTNIHKKIPTLNFSQNKFR